MKPNFIVVPNVVSDQPNRFSGISRIVRSDAFSLKRLVPAFQFAVALWVVRTGSYVRHSAMADKRFEVVRDELRTVIADDPRLDAWVFFQSGLADDFRHPVRSWTREVRDARCTDCNHPKR